MVPAPSQPSPSPLLCSLTSFFLGLAEGLCAVALNRLLSDESHQGGHPLHELKSPLCSWAGWLGPPYGALWEAALDPETESLLAQRPLLPWRVLQAEWEPQQMAECEAEKRGQRVGAGQRVGVQGNPAGE